MKTNHSILMNAATDPAAPGGGGGGAANPAPAAAAPTPSAAPAAAAPAATPEPTARSAGDFLGSKPEAKPAADPAAKPEPKGLLDFINRSISDARAKDGKQPVAKVDEKGGAPAKPAADPAKPAESEKGGFDFETWFKGLVPEAPDGIAKVEDWKTQRQILSKALENVKNLGLEVEMLKKGGATPPKATEPAMPETDAVRKLQVELESLRTTTETELKDWREHKARAELDGNPAFLAEFDGQRSNLLAEMKEAAKEAGIEEGIVNALIEAGSEYKIKKALEDLEDPTAKELLATKAKAFLGLTKAKDTARSNPVAELKKWNDYAESLNGVMATRVTDQLRGAYVNATGDVAKLLTGKDGDVFFRTAGGRATLEGISQRFSRGLDLTPGEVVKALALGEAYGVYRSLSEKQASRIAELEKELTRYSNEDPAKVADPAAPGGGAKASGFSISGMFGGRS